MVGWKFAREFAFSVTPMFIKTLVTISSVMRKKMHATHPVQIFQSLRKCSAFLNDISSSAT